MVDGSYTDENPSFLSVQLNQLKTIETYTYAWRESHIIIISTVTIFTNAGYRLTALS